MIVPFFSLVNRKDISFHGMARSGNHAVIDWIKSMHPEKTDHWNTVDDIPMKFVFRQKSLLIHSYENRSLKEVYQGSLEKFHDLYFGRSGQRFNLLLLRDPFNLFASRLKQVRLQGYEDFIMGHPQYKYGAHQPQAFVNIWKEHAREYLGLTHYLPEKKVCINYNQWFLSQSYRQKIATQLDMEYTEATLNQVVGQNEPGAGSSFDGYEYTGKASRMKVLERWREFVDDDNYRSLFQDSELWDLSAQIFENLPTKEGFFPLGLRE